MSEPIDVAIPQALYAWLIAMPSCPPRAAPFVTGGGAYVPVTGTLYLDVAPLLRAEPEHFGIAFQNSDIERGIFQVDVVAPLGPGELPGTRVAALVKSRFFIGKDFTVNGGRLWVTNTPTIATVKDAPWVRFTVSVPFRFDT